MGRLFLLFVLVPAAELYVLVSVGQVIGTLPTIALVLFTALAGAHLARAQGMSVMRRIQESLDQGLMPAEELLDGMLVLLAGLTLLMPGFLTDVVGLFLLLPLTRNLFKRWLRGKFDQWRHNPNTQIRLYW